jgi:hypothetical protein
VRLGLGLQLRVVLEDLDSPDLSLVGSKVCFKMLLNQLPNEEEAFFLQILIWRAPISQFDNYIRVFRVRKIVAQILQIQEQIDFAIVEVDCNKGHLVFLVPRKCKHVRVPSVHMLC